MSDADFAIGESRYTGSSGMRPALHEPVELPDDLLGPPDRERRDEQHALPAHRVVDDLGQRLDRRVGRFVLPAAVGGLADDEVGVVDWRWVADDRRTGASEVAREDEDRVAAAGRAREAHPHDRRAQDVPGVEQRDVDALRDLVLDAVRDRRQERERCVDIVLRVQRLDEVVDDLRPCLAKERLRVRAARARRALDGHLDRGVEGDLLGRVLLRDPIGVPPLAARGPLRELLLELGGVEQDETRELGRGRGAQDRAAEALADEERQQAAMVEVGVREHHGVERRGIDAQRHAVADRIGRPALEHPAIDEDPGAAGIDEVTRAGDGACPAEEGELHAWDRDTPPEPCVRLCHDAGMTPARRLADLEARYLVARDARDRLDVARATGLPDDPEQVATLESAAATASAAVHEALGAFPAADEAALDPEDRRALETMRAGITVADETELPVGPALQSGPCDDEAEWRDAIRAGGAALQRRLEACYSATASALVVDGATLTRLQVLDRLGTEPDGAARRALFLALEPLWRAVNGDDADGSPYRAYVADARGGVARTSRRERRARGRRTTRPRRGRPPPSRHGGRRSSSPDAPGASRRSSRGTGGGGLGRPHRALGADRAGRGGRREPRRVRVARRGPRCPAVSVSTSPTARADRRVPVAFTTFGGRPHRRVDGSWSPGAPVVLESIGDGGFLGLAELLHETGHAIHIAAIRTRPAFADWPDSDGFTEAIADLVAYDAADPAWPRRWLPGRAEVPLPTSLRDWYALGGPRRRVGAVRGAHADGPVAAPERGLDRDHLDLARDRAPSGVVVVGDARAARPGGRLHGQLRRRLGAWRRRSAPRSGGPAATGSAATRAGTRGSRTRSTGSGWNGRRETS